MPNSDYLLLPKAEAASQRPPPPPHTYGSGLYTRNVVKKTYFLPRKKKTLLSSLKKKTILSPFRNIPTYSVPQKIYSYYHKIELLESEND